MVTRHQTPALILGKHTVMCPVSCYHPPAALDPAEAARAAPHQDRLEVHLGGVRLQARVVRREHQLVWT